MADGRWARVGSTSSSGAGSTGRATAGLLRLGNTLGAAVGDHRVLEPVEAGIVLVAARSFWRSAR